MRIKDIKRARVGLYSAGLKAYWNQFEGLKDRLSGYNAFIAQKVGEEAEVYNFGLVDDEMSARRAGEYFNANNVDIIFAHSATYFTSASMLPAHQICKAPVVLLNLQPAPAMNYEKTSTGEWLAHCVGCPVPEAANAFERAGVRISIVNGLLGLEETPAISVTDEVSAHMPQAKRAWKEIMEFVRAAGVKRTLMHARFGFLGNNYSGMLDMYSDFAMLQAQLGLHVELLEMCDLDRHLNDVTDAEIAEKRKQVESFFTISGDSPSDPLAKKPTDEQLDWSLRVAAAQERMVRAYGLDALSYYYHGSHDNHYERLQSGFIVGHSLLTAAGVPCAGEGDIKTNIAMKICDTLHTGGSFTEIVAMDYHHNTMLLGHDGPFHINISDGKPVLRGMGVYHGKRGSGVSVEANVKCGPVTMLGVTQLQNGKLRMIASEGEAKKLPILMIGNTQTHVDFHMDLDEYMDEWFSYAPTHHCAMSVGHNAKLFEKVAKLLDVEFVKVGK
ncbi:L-fucose/L-arabinose isomerase family protein [Christensenellaceae bacterium OttesenSCG-928-M15]|nr:L-fucose/L-arabinose isomerase family protein [Christensenellaceae bacterium OttesenSCG-928-M15]